MDPHREPGSRTRAIIVTVALVFLFLATFPGHYAPIGTGLDPSWRFALNDLANSDHVFGRDVNFTYGPLGYLLSPVDLGSNLGQAIVLQLIVHAIFAVCVILLARQAARRWQVVAFALVYAAAAALGLTYEYQLVMVTGMLMILSLQSRGLGLVASSLAGLIAAFGLAAKFSLGIELLAMLGLAELVRNVAPEYRNPRATVATVSGFAAGSLVFATLLFDTPSSLLLWLRTSSEITSGYTAAMSLPSHPSVLWMGCVVLLVFGAATVMLFRKRSEAARAALIFSVAVLISFKHGFVRQDVHITSFFPFVLAVLALLVLRTRPQLGMRTLAGGIVAVVTLTVGAYATQHTVSVGEVVRGATGVRGLSNAGSLLMLGRTRQKLAERTRSNLEAVRLPNEWTREIRESGEPLGSYPSEITYAPASGLDWSPNPILQGYSAYTAGLDRFNSEHFADGSAPSYLVLEFSEIDLRHPLLSAPATVRALLRNYELAEDGLRAGRLLLRRVEPRFDDSLEVRERSQALAGEWISVPRSDRLLFAELEMELNVKGRLNEILFRVPPLAIEVEYAGGARRAYRFIPATASNGLLMNFLPASVEDLANLLRGHSDARVVRFRIGGSGALAYRPQIEVSWREAALPIRYARAVDPTTKLQR